MIVRPIKFTPNFSILIEDMFSGPPENRLTVFEAEILNQARADLIKKHFLKYVKAWETMGGRTADSDADSSLENAIIKFSQTYAFGDQSKKVSTEARKLAKVHVVSGIRTAGYVLSQVTKDNLTAMIDKVLQDNDRYVEEARKLVPIGEQLTLLEYIIENEDDGSS